MSAADRLDKFEQFQREVAEARGLPITDERVLTEASLRLAHHGAVEAVVRGDRGAPEILADITRQLAAFSPPSLPTIKITFVEPTDSAPPDAAAVDGLVQCRRCHWKPDGNDRVSKCYRCGWRHGDDTKKPWKPYAPSDAPGAVIEAKAIPEPAASARARAALPPPKAKQDVKREPRHVGGIHDQPGARMRVHHEPWRGHVGTVDNP